MIFLVIFIMIFLYFIIINSFTFNCSIIFVLGTRVNMTKKCMDDRLRVCSCDTQKQQKLHSLLLAPFSLTKHLLVCSIISYTYFVMKNKVPCMLSHYRYVIHYNKINAAKTSHGNSYVSLYVTVIKSYYLSFSSRNKQHCTSC